jgi:hypothetical protein
MFASKTGAYLGGFKCVPATNTLAYWPVASVTKKKSFCMYATYIQNTFFLISESPGTPVSGKHFHSSVAFASKAGDHLSGVKCVPVTNTLAYWPIASVTKKKVL